jgi:hypothetical protein
MLKSNRGPEPGSLSIGSIFNYFFEKALSSKPFIITLEKSNQESCLIFYSKIRALQTK